MGASTINISNKIIWNTSASSQVLQSAREYLQMQVSQIQCCHQTHELYVRDLQIKPSCDHDKPWSTLNLEHDIVPSRQLHVQS